jgi:uracil DNA glycosylase
MFYSIPRKKLFLYSGSLDLVWEFTKYFSPKSTKVVIVGQDPYKQPGISDGLAFSTGTNQIPKSLNKIFTALENDKQIEFKRPNHGSLKYWAHQGVLLLDSALTLRVNGSGSHLNYTSNEGIDSDWKKFKDGKENPDECLGWEDIIRFQFLQ